MIKREELRIGNAVYQHFNDSAQDEVQIIKSIGKEFVSTQEYNEVIPFDDLYGVRLNGFLLSRLGFKQGDNKTINNHFWTIGSSLEISINPENGVVCISKHGDDIKFSIEVLCLHQLQNFYYAIKGKELDLKTINLKT